MHLCLLSNYKCGAMPEQFFFSIILLPTQIKPFVIGKLTLMLLAGNKHPEQYNLCVRTRISDPLLPAYRINVEYIDEERIAET